MTVTKLSYNQTHNELFRKQNSMACMGMLSVQVLQRRRHFIIIKNSYSIKIKLPYQVYVASQTANCLPAAYNLYSSCLPTIGSLLPTLCHLSTAVSQQSACALPGVYQLSASCLSKINHLYPSFLPAVKQLFTSSLPAGCQLSANRLPAVSQLSVSCLPTICHRFSSSIQAVLQLSASSLLVLCQLSAAQLSLPAFCQLSTGTLLGLCQL